MRVCLISIGNELLLGRTVNTNMAFIGKEMAKIGLPVTTGYTISDEADVIKDTLDKAIENHEIVISTGGLGPTTDDITKQTIAAYFGKGLIYRSDLWDKLIVLLQKRGFPISEVNRNQAEVPEDFEVLENKLGTAPGLLYEADGKIMIVLPGVPVEMKYLMQEHVLPYLGTKFLQPALLLRTVHLFGIPEAMVQEKLNDVSIPDGVSLAYLPQTGRVDVRVYGDNKAAFLGLLSIIDERLAQWIWGYDEESPVTKIQEIFLKKGLTLSFAESCTGGLVQKWLTDVPGSSAYFVGGVVSYSNDVKQQLLQVSEENLATYGAVSREVAEQMAVGVRKVCNSDYACAITGIAGPDGGSEDKPVGLVHFAVAGPKGVKEEAQHFIGDRESIRVKAGEYALFMLWTLVGN